MNGCCANLRMFVPSRALTLRTFLYTYMYSQVFVYMYCMMYSFVSEPMLCQIPYVCALASAHTFNLSVCIHIFKSIHISCYRHFRVWTHVVRTHICLLPCQSTLWSSLHTSTYLQKYIYHSKDTRVSIWAHAVQTHILCFCPCECSHSEPLCIHQNY